MQLCPSEDNFVLNDFVMQKAAELVVAEEMKIVTWLIEDHLFKLSSIQREFICANVQFNLIIKGNTLVRFEWMGNKLLYKIP